MPASKKPRKPRRAKKFSAKTLCPGLIESNAIFAPILGALEKIRDTGTVDVTSDDVEIFVDRAGNEAYALLPAMRGWVEAWTRIANKLNRPLCFTSMEKLTNRLAYSMPINRQDVQRAIDEIMECRKVFLTTPASFLREETQTAMIAIEAREIGLFSAQPRHMEAA